MILNFLLSNINDVTNVVNNELKQQGLWFRANKLSLNVNKTNFIMFNNNKQHRTDVHIVLNGTNIEQVTHTTFLGVTNTTLTLLSLIVKGIKTWNSLTETTQLPSLTQFKKH